MQNSKLKMIFLSFVLSILILGSCSILNVKAAYSLDAETDTRYIYEITDINKDFKALIEDAGLESSIGSKGDINCYEITDIADRCFSDNFYLHSYRCGSALRSRSLTGFYDLLNNLPSDKTCYYDNNNCQYNFSFFHNFSP